MTSDSDLEYTWIGQAMEGDMSAFRNLVDRYHPLVAGTVIGMLGPGPDAEDIGQEAFLRFYRSLPEFRGDSKPGTYLTRIAINLCLNEIRSRRRKSTWAKLWNRETVSHNEGLSVEAQADLREQVRRAVLKLDPEYRSVVVLRCLEERSTEETASILEIPIGTVLSRLHRGKRLLKDWLDPNLENRHEK